ncbi:MAG TPA: DinB family protein [Pyrinomonadaceae bacterium]
MSNREEVLKLKQELGSVTENVRHEFGGLNKEQLNWKPSAERWSVAQCLDHLITGNRSYFPLLESIVNERRKTVMIERLPVLPKLWGRLLIKSLDPKSTRKLKAPASFQPAASDLPATIVDQFAKQQDEFASWMDQTKDLQLERLIITSPAMKLITYSLMDGYRFLVLHEQRHFQQAQRVVAESGFRSAEV